MSKWIERLINKLTKSDFPTNISFSYYGNQIIVESSTVDFIRVFVTNNEGKDLFSFSFDFWLKELNVEFYDKPCDGDTIKQSFVKIYGKNNIKIVDEIIRYRIVEINAALREKEKYVESYIGELIKEKEHLKNLFDNKWA